MIDAALVGRKALLIARDLADLAPLARTPLAEYLADSRAELVAERLRERIIGRMIDTNYHLLTETDHPPPADYYASLYRCGFFGFHMAIVAPVGSVITLIQPNSPTCVTSMTTVARVPSPAWWRPRCHRLPRTPSSVTARQAPD